MDHETGESLDSVPSDNVSCEHGDFECNICFEIAQDPIVTLCGHLYCWPCLCEWLQVHSHSHECPVCKALIEDQKLVPIYGRGKTTSDPRSHIRPRMNIPNRPVFGPRPQTAPTLDMNYFRPDELDQMGGFMPMASARFGNLTLSTLFGAIPSFFNLHVQGFHDATVYGATTGVPYLFSSSLHGGYAHGFHHSIHVDGTKFFILGRSGQKVVKRSSASQGNGFSQQTLSRGKRSLGETYRTDSEDPTKSLRKRVRGDKDAGGSRYGRQNGAHIGKNDLRLKLTHRRRQREIHLQIEERKKEQHKRMTRSVQSAEQSHKRLVTSSQPSSGASELLQIEAIRSSYTSQTAGGVRPRSPYRLANDSKEVSSSRNITAAQHIPSVRPAEASRMVHMVGYDLIDSSQLKVLTPVTMRSALGARNPLTGLPSANGGMLQRPYPDQPPLTVASLLNSLGLGKYAIHFQAEEVDMAALKQMGDRDLKELGIPMGPRKKILLAMLSQT